jgi:hypothetical protein
MVVRGNIFREMLRCILCICNGGLGRMTPSGSLSAPKIHSIFWTLQAWLVRFSVEMEQDRRLTWRHLIHIKALELFVQEMNFINFILGERIPKDFV